MDHLLPCWVWFLLSLVVFNVFFFRTSIPLSRASTFFLFYGHFLLGTLGCAHWSHTFGYLTPITNPIPHSLFDDWFNFQTLCSHFHNRKVKNMFSHLHFFFERFALIILSFFSTKLRLKVESKIYSYRWSICWDWAPKSKTLCNKVRLNHPLAILLVYWHWFEYSVHVSYIIHDLGTLGVA